MDLTQVLVDFKRFERTAIWHEFWYGKEKSKEYKPPIFKRNKRNLTKNHRIPKELKSWLNAMRSEIMDPKNRNQVKCNLPVEEINALTELIKLQRERVIIINPCDKGSGIIIMDFQMYMHACYEHLLTKQRQENGEMLDCYTKVEDLEVLRSTAKIEKVIQEGLDKEILNEEEANAMNPNLKGLAKFYVNFKVHKPHEPILHPHLDLSSVNLGQFQTTLLFMWNII